MSDDVRDTIASLIAGLPRLATTPNASGYGRDLVCFDDLSDRLTECDPNSLESLAQDSYHRITTARGSVPDEPDYGIDVTLFLHAGMTPADLAAIGGQCETEIAKDDRVSHVAVTAVWDALTQTLTITAQITPEDPALVTFKLIVSVTDGAALLQEIQAP